MQLIILGSGNVATTLCNAFYKAGHKIAQVYDRNLTSAEKLAINCKAIAIDNVKHLSSDADIVIFCLSDDSISEIASQINDHHAIYIHTSGSVSLQVLKNHYVNCGVFYPLQTISLHREIDLTHVPICIESSNPHSEEKLKMLSKSISQNIHFINSDQRSYLHLAAVIVNNFSNSLYNSAYKLLEDHNLSFRIMHPLILETAMKAIEIGPFKAQTGPAVRLDQLTIKKHLLLLDANPELKKIYQLLTDHIQKQNTHSD